MTKNSKIVAIVAISAAVLLVLAFLARDFLIRRHEVVACPDGPRPTIDIRDFTTQYWGYSAKLELSIADKAKVSTQLDPKSITQVSDALQEGDEFRKYVVAGYNSCAITQAQYAEFGSRFHALDSLAGEINSLISAQSLSPDESAKLSRLIIQYGELARQLASEK